MIEIVERYSSAVLYRSETAESVAAACIEAIPCANLGGADLSGTDLSDADLRGAKLRAANLGGTDLSGADLSASCLHNANLRGANLSGANLSDAGLRGACLRGACLRGACLRGADLGRTDLSGADLPQGMSIMQVLGSQHAIVALYTPDGCELRIGCEHHSLAWWRGRYAGVGRLNDYTTAEIAEYARHIAYIASWAAERVASNT